jgi:hypothetical protein
MLAKASILNDTTGKMRRYAELEKPPTHLELLEFSKQFTREEWEILCKNRGFIHFLAEDLAACRLLAKKVLERHQQVAE